MTKQALDEKAIFLDALKLGTAEERAAFLSGACAGDEALLERVQELLAAHEESRGPLDTPPSQAGSAGTLDHSHAETVGAAIGPYKLLQEVGQGGMGVVYMAEQKEPVKRRVALKIIKPGMDTAQVIARFEAERQALAMMDHPNIAKVLDAGATDSGRPYFVMELVNGVPVTEYCDEQHLTPKQRLELFLPVCQAVQHAHQKGIIHRDLKPSNVLVALYDGQPVPKVIDFGVAKATSQTLTEKTLFTQLGQVVGTLEYMSPEQAQRNQLDVDTRSDVYSLGVVLYELLTGSTPFDKQRLRSAAFDEMLRIIREEEPPRPSIRISTIDTLPSVAANRRTEPQKLSTVVRGELDWIVMKALEKDRGRRYETANGFALDIQRYLGGEAVEACPPSTVYRFRKFVQRNWASVATIAALLIVLCLGLAGTSIGLFAANRAQQQERQARVDAEQQRELAEEKTDLAMQQEQLAERRRVDAEQQRAIANENLYYAEMNIAGLAAQEQSGTRRVAEQLQKWVPADLDQDRRGWEWYYLHSLCNRDLYTLDAHDAEVLSVAWSPDGRQLASAGEDHTVKVWDSVAGKPHYTLKGHTEPVHSVTWSPDGAYLASASEDKTVKVWDVRTGKLVRTLQGHQYAVMSVAWSPNGRQLVSAGGQPYLVSTRNLRFDVAIIIWNADTGEIDHKIHGHTSPIMGVCWSPDSQRLASAAGGTSKEEDWTVRIWNATTGEQQKSIQLAARPMTISWSPDGKQLAWWSMEGAYRLWDVDSKEVPRRHSTKASVRAICWSPDSKRLAVVGGTRTVQILEAATGKEVLNFGTASSIESVSWSADGELLATGNWDGSIVVWDANATPEPLEFGGHPAGITEFCWSPGGDRLASAGRDAAEVKIWNAASGELVQRLDGHRDGAVTVSWSRGGEWVASGGVDGIVRVWDADSGRQLHELRGHKEGVNRVRWSPDDRWLASAGRDTTVRVWNVATGEQEQKLTHSDSLYGLTWSPDAEQLAASVFFPGEVAVWHRSTGRGAFPPFPQRGFTFDVKWSPDGKRLAWGGQTGEITIWDPLKGEDVRFLSQTSTIECVSWSPDNERLAATSASGRVIIWNAATGHEALTLRRSQPAHQVRWSPDGKRLAVATFPPTGPEERQITIWDARRGYEIAQAAPR